MQKITKVILNKTTIVTLFVLTIYTTTKLWSQCPSNLIDYTTKFDSIQSGEMSFIDEVAYKSKVIGIGEDTHGTSEFTTLVDQLFQRLHRNHNYNILIIEDSYGQVRKLNKYIRGEVTELDLWRGNWRYYTEEFRNMIDNLKILNDQNGNMISIFGPEMQYIHEDAIHLQDFLIKNKSDLRLDDLTEFKNMYNEYTNGEIIRWLIILDGVEQELNKLRSSGRIIDDIEEAYMHLEVINQFITAIRPNENDRQHDLREIYMLENIESIIKMNKGAGKVLYWAQNGHIGGGLVNGFVGSTGSQLKKRYGDQYFMLGTEFGRGQFYAYPADANETGWVMAVQEINEVDQSTLTYCLDQLYGSNLYLDISTARSKNEEFVSCGNRVDIMSGAGAQYFNNPVENVELGQLYDGLIYIPMSNPVLFIKE